MRHDTGTIPTYWFRVYDAHPQVRNAAHQVGRWIVSLGDQWGRGYPDVALAVVDDFGNLVRVA